MSRKCKLSFPTGRCPSIPDHSGTARYVRHVKIPHLLHKSSSKLRNGQLVTIPPVLVRRLKSHFVTLPCDVDLILGLNGYIWVSKHVIEIEQEGEEGFDAEAVYSNRNDVSSPIGI